MFVSCCFVSLSQRSDGAVELGPAQAGIEGGHRGVGGVEVRGVRRSDAAVMEGDALASVVRGQNGSVEVIRGRGVLASANADHDAAAQNAIRFA